MRVRRGQVVGREDRDGPFRVRLAGCVVGCWGRWEGWGGRGGVGGDVVAVAAIVAGDRGIGE